MLARRDLQADVGNSGCWLGEESSLVVMLPDWILLGPTIPSKGGLILFRALKSKPLTQQSGNGRFVAAASLRALEVVNEQEVSGIIWTICSELATSATNKKSWLSFSAINLHKQNTVATRKYPVYGGWKQKHPSKKRR